MSNSIADPVITLKLLMDQASLSTVNSQLSDALRKGIQGTEPLFEKLKQYLETAVSKADVGSQIRKQLESGFRALKNTGGTESLVKDFERLEQAGVRFGDSFVQAASRVGRAVAEVGNANAKLIAQGTALDIHPSWDASRSADWNRRLHVAQGKENEQQAAIDHSFQMAERLRSADFSQGVNPHDHGGMLAKLEAAKVAERASFLAERAAYRMPVEALAATSRPAPGSMMDVLSTHHAAATADAAYEQRSAAVSSAEEHSRRDMEQMAARQQRLDWHKEKQQTLRLQERAEMLAQHDPQAAFAAMDLGDRYSQGQNGRHLAHNRDFDQFRSLRQVVDHSDPTRLENYRDTRRPLETAEAYQDRYNAAPLYQQQRMDRERIRADRRSQGGGAFNSHNFRFASQNAAFGIDDAIQSYHYGGFAASARAASNNLTAIAGMGIANPAIAAGTVVALSIATAALPVIMKKFGIDSEEQVKARAKYAEADYQKTGSISGALSRGTGGLATLKHATEGYLALRDQEFANQGMRGFAQATLDKAGFGHDVTNDLAMGNARANIFDKNQLAKFDQAVKWLKEDQLSTPERQSKLNEAEAKAAFVHAKLPEQFRRQEEQRVRDRQSSRDLYHADNLTDFNASIVSAYHNDVAAVRRSGMPEDVQRQRLRELEAKKWEDLNNRSENFRTVQSNHLERTRSAQDTLLSSLGFTSSLSSANVNYDRAYRDTIRNVDGKLDGRGIAERLGVLREGHDKLSGRMLEDEVRANKGFNDPLSALAIDFQRKQQDYSDLRNPYTDKQRAALLKSNQEGFDFHRKRIVDGMLGEHEINNPMGFLARDFKKDAEALERRFADAGNNLTADEKLEMEMNLKRDFQLQKRRANTPQGTEQFLANAIDVGSSQDNELRARMMGNFSRPKDDNGWQGQTLEQFRLMVTQLQQLNAKLTIAAQGLK